MTGLELTSSRSFFPLTLKNEVKSTWKSNKRFQDLQSMCSNFFCHPNYKKIPFHGTNAGFCCVCLCFCTILNHALKKKIIITNIRFGLPEWETFGGSPVGHLASARSCREPDGCPRRPQSAEGPLGALEDGWQQDGPEIHQHEASSCAAADHCSIWRWRR